MATKAQMQAEIERLHNTIYKQDEQIQALKNENETLKIAQGELLDLPEVDKTMSNYHIYEQRRDAAASVLTKVMTWAARNYGGNSEDENEREAQGIGTMLSHHFMWYGDPIILAAAYGCEDANWHTEAQILFKMYDANIAKV